jgi:membrane associated rhomboid family serine protease
VTVDYDDYVHRAGSLLMAQGAHEVLPASATQPAARWFSGWDAILINEGPGTRSVYAFTRLNGGASFQEHLDRLAESVARSGILGGAPLNLVAIAVAPSGVDTRTRRTVTGAAPRTYFAGLRPSTVLVDLRQGEVFTPRFGRGAERATLRAAIDQASEGVVLDAQGVSQLQRESVQRTQAFYALMQGRQPIVTYGLIVINVALFLLLYTKGGPDNEAALRDMGALSPALVEQGQWWRLCTSMFLHASVAHILFNMTSLFAVGTLAERLYGHLRFLAIYLGSGLIGSLTSFAYAELSGNTNVLGVGASGAIFGVAGALLTLPFQSSDVIPKRLRERISTSLLPLVVLSLIVAFLTPHVDNSAHLGGLLGGMALSFVFPLTKTASVGQ